ncbi:fatty acyl-CoA reductase 3-like [Benincasa hispida]|uniref:fatty acyl-CoA reductase 3-like n=1 Tax=Benincasa hispida TaxID=102211 RepID=UPI0019012F13|nr:fatty acyl-CoA reductase 3-like [Benincasa hispida]
MEECGNAIGFLENKSILITGSTGFLAKILVEKILRIQPNVRKLYLLLRAADEIIAMQRFCNEVMEKDLFRVLKKKWGANLNTFISEKVCVVSSDISLSHMGLKNSILVEEIKHQVQIIINLAATTNFNERYDVALGTNTLGAKHVVNFAKQCPNFKLLVHVSTAFISGEREGLILETPHKLGESLNGTEGLNIEIEQKVVEERLKQLKDIEASEKVVTIAMKDLGIQRANMFGWPNTYTFTKAMGEMVIDDLKDNLPLIVIRPTIVTSTYKEPFPGWIEGARTIDSLIVGYAKGKLTFFCCDINSILDVIPADLVVNTIIKTMTVHKLQICNQIIYHVGSSIRNPMKMSDLRRFMFQYFTEKPWINGDGNAIKAKKVNVFNNLDSFHRYITIRYLFFLKVLEWVNKALCHSFEDKYIDLKRKLSWVMRLLQLYRPYLFFKARFDDTNFEKLGRPTRDNETDRETLFLDPKDINWENYFVNVHIPGLVKYVIK